MYYVAKTFSTPLAIKGEHIGDLTATVIFNFRSTGDYKDTDISHLELGQNLTLLNLVRYCSQVGCKDVEELVLLIAENYLDEATEDVQIIIEDRERYWEEVKKTQRELDQTFR